LLTRIAVNVLCIVLQNFELETDKGADKDEVEDSGLDSPGNATNS